MRYGVLGPLEVNDGERPVELTGGKQRALLAMLLLNANRVVSTGRLVDALWEDAPPETAAKAVQVLVSQLRKLLGKESLETRAPGYRLRVGPEALDLERFQRLVGEGELDEALSLWRGPPLGEFTHSRFAQADIARLQELHLACLEERIERDLARGRHVELVGELESLVREHPLRERARAQLMVCLYRSGRQAEALAAYQHARSTLIDELGIEPSRGLRALHQSILNQDPSLDLPAEELAERTEPDVTIRLPSAQPPARDVRKTVTAVSVAMAILPAPGDGLDPEALRRVTVRAFGDVEVAVGRHGGTVETVTSDAMTTVFGLPLVHEDDALRGIRAAAQIREALGSLAGELAVERALELEFRIGISTGEVISDMDAGPLLRTTGEPLQLSSRLAQAGGPGEIMLDEGTRRLVREVVIADPVNDAWRLVGIADAAPARRLVSPMVGREREGRRLQDAFSQSTSDHSCQLFTVLGLAGVGKSRLVQEFLDRVAEDALIARGRCLPYGEGITYWPLLEAVNEAVGLEDTDSPEQVQKKLRGALGNEEGAEQIALRVAELIGHAEAGAGSEEGFVATRSLFETLARIKPLVLLFDDIHWGEATFLDLVEHLADWTRDAPVLLVCLARPELLDLRPGWGGGKLNATVALLEPLSDEECFQLIENLVGRSELAVEVGAKIAEAAEGNPLFVEEMLAMLIDDGLLVHEDGDWRPGGDISSVRVPPTIQALLAARLDQLGPSERAVIERAAVAGKIFAEAAVAALASEALHPTVAEALGALVRKELIRPERSALGGRTYRFRHLLIRDAAYESIPKEARAEFHEQFGRWLDGTDVGRTTEYDAVIGYHFEQSYLFRAELGSVDDAARAVAREAAERLGSAGRRAFARSDAPAGTNLIARAAALLRPDDPLRVELIPNVRVIQGLGGDMGWADRVLTEAVEAAATTGDRRFAAHALVQRGLLRLFTESQVTSDELIDAADRSILVFEEHDDDLGLARAWRLIAQAHYLARRAGACADASRRALEHIRRTENRFEEQEIIEWLLVALLLGPAPAAAAFRQCDELRRLAAAHPLLQPQILGSMATLAAMQDRLDEANELVARSQAKMAEFDEGIGVALFYHSFVFLWQGELEAAERQLRTGYDALKTMGEKSHFSAIAHALANVCYLQRRYDEADQLTRECEHAARPNDVNSQILWRSIRAKVHARRGDAGAATALAEAAVTFASQSDFHPAHADAQADLAEVLLLTGDQRSGAAAMREAARLYELKGNTLLSARLRRQLGTRTPEE